MRLLDWRDTEATVAHNLSEAAELLQAKRDENTCRNDLAVHEAVSMRARVRKAEDDAAKKRQRATRAKPGNIGRNPTGQGTVPTSVDKPTGQARDLAAEGAGYPVSIVPLTECEHTKGG